MKRIILSMLAITILVLSCKKSFYSEVNNNPNAPSSVTIVPNVLLSTVEAAIAYTQGGDLSRFSSLITQQTFGASRQSQGYYRYIFSSQDFDNTWANIYTASLENNITLTQLADAGGNNAYSGISRILTAYTLQVVVDTWGAMPYSQSFRGALNLQPAFDTDQGLYDTIVSLVDEGIAKLLDPDPGARVPGTEDVIYGGDATKWIKFGHAIKARIYLHQSKGNATMANNALAEIALSFADNSDNAQYVFGETETSANPWYQFNQQRTDISFFNSTLATHMIALNDPRYRIFVDTANIGGPEELEYYGLINSPVEFITYDELLFMKAEATLTSTGDISSAQTFFQQAITANMQKLSVTDADMNTYVAANGTLPGDVPGSIAAVAEQAYYALYLNPEAWVLWRRTGSPAFILPVQGNNVPRRFLYPQTEYSYNVANIPLNVTLFTPRLFWDN